MIENKSTGMSIVDVLRDSIRAGVWAPGVALRQADLAEQFGTSRIPVREALQTLQSEGLVTIEPNRGAFIATLARDELDEIFDLRVLLEADVLRHAVPHHDARTLRHLATVQKELNATSDPHEWIRLDRLFHHELYAPAGRVRTVRAIDALRAQVERFYLAKLGPRKRRRGWKDEHETLLAAVKGGEVKRAVALLEAHLRATQALAIAALDGPVADEASSRVMP